MVFLEQSTSMACLIQTRRTYTSLSVAVNEELTSIRVILVYFYACINLSTRASRLFHLVVLESRKFAGMCFCNASFLWIDAFSGLKLVVSFSATPRVPISVHPFDSRFLLFHWCLHLNTWNPRQPRDGHVKSKSSHYSKLISNNSSNVLQLESKAMHVSLIKSSNL